MRSEPIAAAILAGGRSRRMGAPKAALRLAPDGPTIVGSVIATLRRITDEIVLVGADREGADDTGLPWIRDIVPDAGPLGGIHAALIVSPRDRLLVVACDMPFLNTDLLRYMAMLPHDCDVLLPVVGQPQPLHAIYARSCLPVIEAYFAAGHRRVDGWFGEVRVRTIVEAVVKRFDPDLRSCFNMNTPADLERARDTIRRG